MDQNQILSIMHEVFKSLTVSQIDILELNGPMLSVRVVAEGYSEQDIPERVDILLDCLMSKAPAVAKNYAISFEPLTPAEFAEWYDEGSGSGNSFDGSQGGMAAKSVDI